MTKCREHWLSLCKSTMHTMVIKCFPDGGLMNINIGSHGRGLKSVATISYGGLMEP